MLPMEFVESQRKTLHAFLDSSDKVTLEIPKSKIEADILAQLSQEAPYFKEKIAAINQQALEMLSEIIWQQEKAVADLQGYEKPDRRVKFTGGGRTTLIERRTHKNKPYYVVGDFRAGFSTEIRWGVTAPYLEKVSEDEEYNGIDKVPDRFNTILHYDDLGYLGVKWLVTESTRDPRILKLLEGKSVVYPDELEAIRSMLESMPQSLEIIQQAITTFDMPHYLSQFSKHP